MTIPQMKQAFRALLSTLTTFEMESNWLGSREDYEFNTVYTVENRPVRQVIHVVQKDTKVYWGEFSYDILEGWLFDCRYKIDHLFVDEWLEQRLRADLNLDTMEALL